MTFVLASSAFSDNEPIPARFTGDGDDISPALTWQDPPAGTKSFALIVDDPDAPGVTFQHWGIYNLGGDLRELPEAAATGFDAATNDFGTGTYRGPKPPRGRGVHHYRFRLQALDVDRLALPANAAVGDLWTVIRPHALGEAVLVGTYER